MRIFIITQEEPFYLPQTLNTIMQARRANIVGATVLPPAFRNEPWPSFIKRQLALYGIKDFLVHSFLFTLYKTLDKLSHLIPFGGYYSVRAVCRHYDVPVYDTISINDPEYSKRLSAVEPDVVISIAATQVFREQLLKLPRYGCINVHSGLLPKYRGWLPTFWALANGENETGVTVHYMGEGLDDGDIILQRQVSIAPNDTLHSLIVKCKEVGVELLLEALERVESGTVVHQPNPREQATYYSFPSHEDARRFRARGRRFR